MEKQLTKRVDTEMNLQPSGACEGNTGAKSHVASLAFDGRGNASGGNGSRSGAMFDFPSNSSLSSEAGSTDYRSDTDEMELTICVGALRRGDECNYRSEGYYCRRSCWTVTFHASVLRLFQTMTKTRTARSRARSV